MPYTRKVPTGRFAMAHSSTRQAPLPHHHAGKLPVIHTEYRQTKNATTVPQNMGHTPLDRSTCRSPFPFAGALV